VSRAQHRRYPRISRNRFHESSRSTSRTSERANEPRVEAPFRVFLFLTDVLMEPARFSTLIKTRSRMRFSMEKHARATIRAPGAASMGFSSSVSEIQGSREIEARYRGRSSGNAEVKDPIRPESFGNAALETRSRLDFHVIVI